MSGPSSFESQRAQMEEDAEMFVWFVNNILLDNDPALIGKTIDDIRAVIRKSMNAEQQAKGD